MCSRVFVCYVLLVDWQCFVNMLCYFAYAIAYTLVRCVLVFRCVWFGVVSVLQAETPLVCSCGIANQPTKHITHMRTQQSQNRKHHNSQYQQKHAYQLQQFDKASHTKRTPLHTTILR